MKMLRLQPIISTKIIYCIKKQIKNSTLDGGYKYLLSLTETKIERKNEKFPMKFSSKLQMTISNKINI